jgi:hypothetical protein
VSVVASWQASKETADLNLDLNILCCWEAISYSLGMGPPPHGHAFLPACLYTPGSTATTTLERLLQQHHGNDSTISSTATTAPSAELQWYHHLQNCNGSTIGSTVMAAPLAALQPQRHQEH